MNARTLLEGVGASLLLLESYYLPFLSPHLTSYHHRLPVTNLVGGLLVDMLGLSILAIAFLVSVQHLPQVLQRILKALFASFTLWRIVDVAIQLQTDLRITAYWSHARRSSGIAIFLLSGLLAYFLPRIAQPAVRAVCLVVAASALSAVWIIPQLLFVAAPRKPNYKSPLPQLSSAAHDRSNQRIIWILFDELSFQETFDHPAPGIQLPNFQRLRAGSVSFGNVKPVGFFTDRIIPSLLLGRRIDRIRSTMNGQLWYRDESQSRWLAYDPNATLFGLARQIGWNTGVDGWYNPYCGVLAPVLNVCSWEPKTPPIELHGTSEDKSVLANAIALPMAFFTVQADHRKAEGEAQIEAYRNILAHTQALIEDNQVQFVFLHLPIPHPPGIYDRQRHLLRPGGTYLDNLVLADDTLGALMQEIDATQSASRTTVIVSSDHSWRIPIWRNADFWSTEEERASGGRFDDRPVLLIHFPGQNAGKEVNSALPELLEHEIIAGMLRGKINNSADLEAFIAQQGR